MIHSPAETLRVAHRGHDVAMPAPWRAQRKRHSLLVIGDALYEARQHLFCRSFLLRTCERSCARRGLQRASWANGECWPTVSDLGLSFLFKVSCIDRSCHAVVC
jgi:hypothetical protein